MTGSFPARPPGKSEAVATPSRYRQRLAKGLWSHMQSKLHACKENCLVLLVPCPLQVLHIVWFTRSRQSGLVMLLQAEAQPRQRTHATQQMLPFMLPFMLPLRNTDATMPRRCGTSAGIATIKSDRSVIRRGCASCAITSGLIPRSYAIAIKLTTGTSRPPHRQT